MKENYYPHNTLINRQQMAGWEVFDEEPHLGWALIGIPGTSAMDLVEVVQVGEDAYLIPDYAAVWFEN